MALLGTAAMEFSEAALLKVTCTASWRSDVAATANGRGQSRSVLAAKASFLGGRSLHTAGHIIPAAGSVSTGPSRKIGHPHNSRVRTLRVEAGVPGGKCPFGFSGEALREGREEQRGGGSPPGAVSAPVAPPPTEARPLDADVAPYTFAPASRPGVMPLGPNNFEYLPFKIPYKMAIGIEPVPTEGLVEIDEFYAEEMLMRRDVLDKRSDVAIARLPLANVDEAVWELCDILTRHVTTYHADMFAFEGPVFHNKVTGESWDLSDKSLDPLDVLGRNLQEDLCLMLPDSSSSEMKLVAGVVAFPMRWHLLQKMGLNLDNIHLPVPLYSQIGLGVRGFIERLKEQKLWMRSNWAITDNPTLHQPLTEADVYAMRGDAKKVETDTVTVENAGDRLHTRSERQVFMRLPKSRAVLFTIRTYIKPLRVFEDRPMLADTAIKALDAMPPELKDYKSMVDIQVPAREYLQRIVQRHLAAGTYKPEDAVPAAKGPAIIGWKSPEEPSEFWNYEI